MARKVIDVRIVNAATDGQESAIQELSSELFQNVFPLYFSELEIQRFKKRGVLSLQNQRYQGTLKEAFQIMACLQTVHIMLSKPHPVYDVKERALFDKNCALLNECGMSFPFTYDDFETGAGSEACGHRRLI
ncbi:hypothetical protein A6g_06470 [Bacillus velezensis]|uniref:DUF5365 family protein n=1 Tax=Bacillus velezensis TaxID=492670 RepID=UPI00100AA5A2|nr:DUF5365 family protein [Bacillus velezensis]MEC3796175.1 DUF5365 family protein [Bacillus velezensis]RXK30751.1 hypothetical protein A6g_06470 [Bacillus velezensis]